MQSHAKLNLISDLQDLKKAYSVRITLLRAQAASIEQAPQRDFSTTIFEDACSSTDIILGDLKSGYFSQNRELAFNSNQIEEIREKLEAHWRSIPEA